MNAAGRLPEHELLAEIRGSGMSAKARRELEALVRKAAHNRKARQGGIAKARRKRTEAINAAIARNRLKTPLTAPDFVEQVLQNFARSGERAPGEDAIRAWRDSQISITSPDRRETG